MAELEQVNAKVDKATKEEAEKVFKELGMTRTAAINIFYRQVILHHGLPFEVTTDVPNARLRQAIENEEDDIAFSDPEEGLDYLNE